MGRLTKRNEQDTAYYYPVCFEKCEGFGASEKCDICAFSHIVCEKLGRYEDREEKWHLLWSPVLIGNVLYTNRGQRKKDYKAPYRIKVAAVTINGDEKMGGGYFICHYAGGIYSTAFSFLDIGKEVFLTKAEAELAAKAEER